MKVVVSVEEKGYQKCKVGEFVSSYYASKFIEAVLQENVNKNNYVKITDETEEE